MSTSALASADRTAKGVDSIAKDADTDSARSEGLDRKLKYPGINEAKVLRKIDVRVVPVLCILYLLAFLDRVNISNAAIFGLKQDLSLKGNEFNTALLIFFVPYVVFEIPSNALLKRFKPHVWLSACMFMFGLTTTLQGLTQNYSGILATRFFLGLFETGMFPGCFYLLAMWYKRSEAQKRYSFFFSSVTLAGAFGGLLASAIGKMDGIRGYHGWRWIFILEGILTSLLSIWFFFIISDFPEEAKWLSQDEKEFVKARLREDVGDSQRDKPLTFRGILGILSDYKVVAGGFMYLGLIVPGYGYAYFAPSIIQQLGHGNIQTQLLSVPPWAACFVFTMAIAFASDKTGHRFAFAVMPTAIALAGFIILLVVHDNKHLQYAALFLAVTGTFSAMPIMICWYSMNLGGHNRRAVATGWQIGFGNIGGIIASYSFLAKDAPRYIPGYSICIAFICLSVLATAVYFCGIVWENRKRGRGDVGGSELSLVEKSQLGDLCPDYRYLL